MMCQAGVAGLSLQHGSSTAPCLSMSTTGSTNMVTRMTTMNDTYWIGRKHELVSGDQIVRFIGHVSRLQSDDESEDR